MLSMHMHMYTHMCKKTYICMHLCLNSASPIREERQKRERKGSRAGCAECNDCKTCSLTEGVRVCLCVFVCIYNIE